MVFLSSTKLVYSPVAIGHDVAQLLSSSLKFFELEIDPVVPIRQEILQLFPFLFESVDQGLVVSLYCFDIDGMQAGQAFLHIEQLLLVLSLPLVNFLTEETDLEVEFFSLASVVFQRSSQFLLQVGDFCIFDFDEFAETIELGREALILLAHVLSQVADLIVEEGLELAPQLFDFIVLFLHHHQEVFPILPHYLLQSLYLSFLLPTSSILLLERRGVGIVAFAELLRHAVQFELVVFFGLKEVATHAGQFLFGLLAAAGLLLGGDQLGPFLCICCSFLPEHYFSQQLLLLPPSFNVLLAPFYEFQSEFFILGSQVEELLLFAEGLLFDVGLLPKEHVIFDLIILCPPQSQSSPIEFIPHRQDILLQSFRLPAVEVDIVASRGK